MTATQKSQKRVVVVGLGSIGQRHARLIAERADIDMTACDLDAVRQEETRKLVPKARVIGDLKAALAPVPDAVLICTPNRFHLPVGEAVLATGTRVLIEKPIADTTADGQRLIELAQKSQATLIIGYMLRFDPGLQIVRQLITSGELGTLVAGRAMIGTYTTLLCAKNNDRETQPNSLVFDYTHEIDFMSWLLGSAQSVLAVSAQRGDFAKRPNPNVFQMILETESGALAQIHMDYVQHPQRRNMEIIGDKGSVAYDFMTGQLRHYRLNGEEGGAILDVAPIRQRVDDLYRAQLVNLLDPQPGVASSGQEACRALKVAETAIESVKTGRKVMI